MVKNQARFTGDEDRALQEIMREAQARCEAPRDNDPKPGRGPLGVRWKTVAADLEARGFAKRSPQSVRNHYLRHAKVARGCYDQKNFCRKCGLLKRGHVCLATTTSAS